MSNTPISYSQRADASHESEASALCNVYRLVVDSAKQRGHIPDKSGPADAKGPKYDRARAIVHDR